MVELSGIVSTLRATRRELASQLDSIDKAIAALTSAPPSTDVAGVAAATVAAQPDAPLPLVATRLKPKRVLADAHKEALAKGRRRAREVREAAAGRAREMPDDSFVPALAPASGTEPPRLIKKQRGVA
jgi:hypothetical protein